MKALTLTQPWASLVALGHKRFETRSWSTNYRGELAIHAAAGYPRWAREFTAELIEDKATPGLSAELPRGAVLCVVRLVGIHRTQDLKPTFLEESLGDWHPGRFAWALELVEVFDQPLPARGALGLWEWKP